MSYYDEAEWQRGKIKALRQLPRHVTLADPDEHWNTARSLFWLGVKTLAGAMLLILIYAVAQ